MTITEQVKSILAELYFSEDGDEYKVQLLPGLTDQELENLARGLPNRQIPTDINELLRFTSGFEFEGFADVFVKGRVTFNVKGEFGFEKIFPNSIQLAKDGFGNFWILDIDSNSIWGNVFYVCHNPPVVITHSENLLQFIQDLQDFEKNGKQSNLDIIQEKSVMKVWQDDNSFIELDNARQSSDTTLKEFALSLADNYVIADLRNKPNKSGFAWGKFVPKIENAFRHNSKLLWAIEKPIKKGGFLSKLFGR